MVIYPSTFLVQVIVEDVVPCFFLDMFICGAEAEAEAYLGGSNRKAVGVGRQEAEQNGRQKAQ